MSAGTSNPSGSRPASGPAGPAAARPWWRARNRRGAARQGGADPPLGQAEAVMRRRVERPDAARPGRVNGVPGVGVTYRGEKVAERCAAERQLRDLDRRTAEPPPGQRPAGSAQPMARRRPAAGHERGLMRRPADAAVNGQRRAGDRGREGAGEVGDARRDLVGGDQPAQGCRAFRAARSAAGSPAWSSSRPTQGVSAVPGFTQLTRMPSWMWSAAIARVRDSTAPLVAEYSARCGRPGRWPRSSRC